jgi:three-Cys-motif partner protein
MSKKPKNPSWQASPHTIAKIDILRSYLFKYYSIMGRAFNGTPLQYVDCFAGPNVYTNHPIGSPSAALVAIDSAMRSLGSSWVAGDVHCAFIEEDKRRFELLSASVLSFPNPRILISCHLGKFADLIDGVLRSADTAVGRELPTFAFVDPFGAAGVPFDSIMSIMSRASSEMLMNLDADGIARNTSTNSRLLDDIFGDIDWRQERKVGQSLDAQSRWILHRYKERLESEGVPYRYQTEMRGKTNGLNYFLLFAGRHPKGMMRMKESMKLGSQSGSYVFSDSAFGVGQGTIIYDELNHFSRILFDGYRGRKVAYDAEWDAVTAFALNNTPYFNAKAILKHLYDTGSLVVRGALPRRRPSDFGKSVREIEFTGEPFDGSLF